MQFPEKEERASKSLFSGTSVGREVGAAATSAISERVRSSGGVRGPVPINGRRCGWTQARARKSGAATFREDSPCRLSGEDHGEPTKEQRERKQKEPCWGIRRGSILVL